MSDSSEDEDLSRFKEVVDTSYMNLLQRAGNKPQENQKKKSERYLEESSHYNDVKVPEKMQNQIGTKITNIINKSIEFIDVEIPELKKLKTNGGVKLFNTSEGFLSCEQAKDEYTAQHNIQSKKILMKRRHVDEEQNLSENEKVAAVTVTGEQILSKEDTKMWRSRRKEKLFKYKPQGKGKVLVAVD